MTLLLILQFTAESLPLVSGYAADLDFDTSVVLELLRLEDEAGVMV